MGEEPASIFTQSISETFWNAFFQILKDFVASLRGFYYDSFLLANVILHGYQSSGFLLCQPGADGKNFVISLVFCILRKGFSDLKCLRNNNETII